ncbi:hypothetical protein GCM10007063_00030 [Lentibacillus kapialis]|uniref:Uncharacterized protein n=1 Tax=Lentibacillus kapialis TaxID=340214 RepID=A0A917PJB5_9BACI|nr:hypothetical protein GCM10007063_00030 [Lentibacillus kapialis]
MKTQLRISVKFRIFLAQSVIIDEWDVEICQSMNSTQLYLDTNAAC